MSKRSVIIFASCIVAFFVAAKYFESVSFETNKLRPLPMKDKEVKSQSLLETVVFHFTRPNLNSKNFIRSGADSDKSQCGMQPNVTEMVTTAFAGYMLKYPCTAGSKGSIRIEKSDDGKIISQEYTLYLGIQLGSKNSSIWNDRTKENSENESFLLILKSNTKPKFSPIFKGFKSDYTHYKSDGLSGLEIYFKATNPRRVIGVLSEVKDSSGYPPVVSCYLDAEDEIENVFSDLYNLNHKFASCNAHWMLTKDISLNIHSFNAEFANDFKILFESIDPEIKEIIKTKPKQ